MQTPLLTPSCDISLRSSKTNMKWQYSELQLNYHNIQLKYHKTNRKYICNERNSIPQVIFRESGQNFISWGDFQYISYPESFL